MATTPAHHPGKAIAAGISVLYALIAGLWVYASDALLYLFVRDIRQLATLQSLKGLVFIVITALYLYLLVSNRLAKAHGEKTSDIDTVHPIHSPKRRFFPYSWGVYTLLAIFLLLASTIVGAGYMGYQLQKTTLQQERQAELRAIAVGKAEQIAHWIAERRSDAAVFADDPFFAREVGRWLAVGSSDERRAEQLRQRLISLRDAHDYAAVAVLDARGRVRLSTNASLVDEDVRALALKALQTDRIQLSDLHLHEQRGKPRAAIDMVAPLSPSSNLHGQVRGAVYFQIDPQRYLFPLIQRWPTPSASAEVVLVRREADEIVFLNQLRHRNHPALTFRLPLKDPHLPAAMAARGQEGIVEGFDYRRVSVLAAVRKVPNTPWFLLAKVNTEEIYAPLRTTMMLMTLLAGVFISAAGIGVGLWWQQQRTRFLAEHYRSELKRRVLVQHYDYIAKYANDIVLLMNESGQVLEANDRAVSAYGYSRQELLQHNIRALRAPETLDSLATQIDQVKHGAGLMFETVHRRKDGSCFPVEISARLIAADGKRFLHSIIRNISERKQAEMALRESETRYRTLFEQAPDTILLVDWQTAKIEGFNDTAYENLGYTREEFARLNVADIDCRETEQQLIDHAKRIIATGVDNFETQHRTKQGEIRHVLINSRVIEINGKTLIQNLCRDITERKRIEAQMRQQETQLIQADKMAALGTLVSGVAHEINNPNHMIQMNAQSLLETWADLIDFLDDYLDEAKTHWIGDLSYAELCETFPLLLQDIAKGAARIEKIVASLKDFARPSAKTIASLFNLNEAVNQALSLLKHTINKRTDSMKVDLQPDLPPLIGDIQQMEQVIVNLVLNALDALPNRNAGIRISTRLDPATKTMELQVQDEGVGIPPEHLQRIYEPFFTTKQDQGGTGLGLFITYKLVTAHGGNLAFTSQPGEGTTARVTLPLEVDFTSASSGATHADSGLQRALQAKVY